MGLCAQLVTAQQQCHAEHAPAVGSMKLLRCCSLRLVCGMQGMQPPPSRAPQAPGSRAGSRAGSEEASPSQNGVSEPGAGATARGKGQRRCRCACLKSCVCVRCEEATGRGNLEQCTKSR